MARFQAPRFRLLELMALVVAVAVGIELLRSFGNFVGVYREVRVDVMISQHQSTTVSFGAYDNMNRVTAAAFKPPFKGTILFWARQVSFWPGPPLAALTLVTLGLGLEQSRRFASRPGMAVCVGVAVTLALFVAAVRLPNLLISGTGAASPIHLAWKQWWLELWFTAPRLAGFAVATTWVAVALVGRWEAREGWLDRLGIVLGAAWIGMAAIDLGATWYYALPF